jgi:hypothetical protein
MSILTIHKKILKDEYDKSILGRLERKMNKIYDSMKLYGFALPEDVAKKVYDIRERNENEQKSYIDITLKLDRENVDNMLYKSMKHELEILENYFNQSTAKTSTWWKEIQQMK